MRDLELRNFILSLKENKTFYRKYSFVLDNIELIEESIQNNKQLEFSSDESKNLYESFKTFIKDVEEDVKKAKENFKSSAQLTILMGLLFTGVYLLTMWYRSSIDGHLTNFEKNNVIGVMAGTTIIIHTIITYLFYLFNVIFGILFVGSLIKTAIITAKLYSLENKIDQLKLQVKDEDMIERLLILQYEIKGINKFIELKNQNLILNSKRIETYNPFLRDFNIR